MKRVGNIKKCSRCGETKDVSEFSGDKYRKDGLACACRVCKRASYTKWAKENPEKLPIRNVAYRQRHPERVRANGKASRLRNAAKINARAKAYREANDKAVKHRIALWRETHKDQIRALNHKYRAMARGARVVGVEVTDKEIDARWAMWGGKCWICGGDAEATDHMKPLAAGGLHVPANLRPICHHCNSVKGAKWRGSDYYKIAG